MTRLAAREVRLGLPASADRRGRAGALVLRAPGVWLLPSFADAGLVHGFGGRSVTAEALVERLGWGGAPIARLEQVHGSAIVEIVSSLRADGGVVAGADGAITDCAGVALTIRTADCAPVGFYDSAHRAIGAAHVGWRGLAAALPQRMVGAMRRRWGTRAADVRIAIGPAIGACCYEVGPAFAARFPAWVRHTPGRRTLDLRAGIIAQLRDAGVRAAQINDSGVCTACQVDRFYSYRREGGAAGRCHFAVALTAPGPTDLD